MARKNLSAHVERRLEEYYGGKCCVVCGSKHAQYHHLDDDDRNTTFTNLVPLGSQFNSPILRDARSRASSRLIINAELEPKILLLTAQKWFSQWKVAQAYACARLAYFIAKNYLQMDSELRLPFACSALYFARHSVRYDLIGDILSRDVLPIARESVLTKRARALIVQEIAGLLSEHGRYKESLRLYQTLPEALLLSTANADKFAAFLRRKATSIIAERGKTPNVEALLRDADNAAPHSENIRASIANTLGWDCLSKNDYKGAFDILAPLEKRYRRIFTPGGNVEPINITAWNAAEIFHSYGIAACHLGGRYQRIAENALHKASVIFESSRSRPFLLREDIWERQYRALPDQAAKGMTVQPLARLPPNIDAIINEILRQFA